jgi:hypothetical protein
MDLLARGTIFGLENVGLCETKQLRQKLVPPSEQAQRCGRGPPLDGPARSRNYFRTGKTLVCVKTNSFVRN